MGNHLCLACLLGFTLACIGFNVMHDANHGSYSSSERVNNLLGLTLNALGGNSFIWKFKHNIIHHTYPNVDGMDDDIAKSPFIRMCSTQRLGACAPGATYLYAVVVCNKFYDMGAIQDFEKYFLHKINTIALAKMKLEDHFIFWISKVFYILFYIVLPVLADWLDKLAVVFHKSACCTWPYTRCCISTGTCSRRDEHSNLLHLMKPRE